MLLNIFQTRYMEHIEKRADFSHWGIHPAEMIEPPETFRPAPKLFVWYDKSGALHCERFDDSTVFAHYIFPPTRSYNGAG